MNEFAYLLGSLIIKVLSYIEGLFFNQEFTLAGATTVGYATIIAIILTLVLIYIFKK
jgi:hypothetical protein